MSLLRALGFVGNGPLVVSSKKAIAANIVLAVQHGSHWSLLTRDEGVVRLWVRSTDEPGAAELVLSVPSQEQPIVFLRNDSDIVLDEFERLSRGIKRAMRLQQPFGAASYFLSGAILAAIAGAFACLLLYMSLASSALHRVNLSGDLNRPSTVLVSDTPGRPGIAGAPALPAEIIGGVASPPSQPARLGGTTEQQIVAAALEVREAILTGRPVSDEQLARLPPEVQRVAREALALRLSSTESRARSAAGPNSPPPPTSLFDGVTASGEVIPTDRFGVPTLPTEGAQVRRAERPRLPLPGGGDLRAPDDLRLFGLSPH